MPFRRIDSALSSSEGILLPSQRQRRDDKLFLLLTGRNSSFLRIKYAEGLQWAGNAYSRDTVQEVKYGAILASANNISMAIMILSLVVKNSLALPLVVLSKKHL